MIERLLQQYETLVKYFNDFDEKDSATQRRRFRKINEKLTYPTETKVQLLFLKNVGPLFQNFLEFFQKKGPLIHILHTRLLQLVQQLMLRFVKKEYVVEKSSNELKGLELSSSEAVLDDEKMIIGEDTSAEMKKLKGEKQRQ